MNFRPRDGPRTHACGLHAAEGLQADASRRGAQPPWRATRRRGWRRQAPSLTGRLIRLPPWRLTWLRALGACSPPCPGRPWQRCTDAPTRTSCARPALACAGCPARRPSPGCGAPASACSAACCCRRAAAAADSPADSCPCPLPSVPEPPAVRCLQVISTATGTVSNKWRLHLTAGV